jgi:hypothetical protein
MLAESKGTVPKNLVAEAHSGLEIKNTYPNLGTNEGEKYDKYLNIWE